MFEFRFPGLSQDVAFKEGVFGLAKGQRGMDSGFVDNCCLAFLHETRTALRP